MLGTGELEIAALRDLDDHLRGVSKSDGGRMDEFREGAAGLHMGAEEAWQRLEGRPMTEDELGGSSTGRQTLATRVDQGPC